MEPEVMDNIIDVSEQDFQAQVLEQSRHVPVLVDFWAPWCGPCKALTPTLEKLARERSGKLVLAKVNVDEAQRLAQALMIQSIPNVKLFRDGQLVDEFMGALPEPEIARFLDHYLPSGGDDEALQALEMYLAGNTDAAVPMLERVHASDPKNAVALVGLSHRYLDEGELDRAREFISQVNEVALERAAGGDKELDKLVTALRAKLFLTEEAGKNGGGELDARLADACQAALNGEHERALEGLLDIVRTDRTYREDVGRRAMLAVFDLLPADSTLARTYRNKLSSVLFA